MITIDPLLVETGKGLSISYKNKSLYSKYNPQNSNNKYLENIKLQDKTIYIIPSPLLGYGLSIVKERLPSSSIILQIEIDPLLHKISKNQKCIYLTTKGFDFIQVLQSIDFSQFKKCDLIRLNGGYDLYRDKYNRLLKILLNYQHNYWKNRYTSTKMGQLWIKNCLKNIDTLHNSYPFEELKSDKPIVVVGAGESLESTLGLLKENRESVFILSVDTALQSLLEVDIKPDAVLALEAQYYNLPDFYGAKNLNIDLIYDLSSYPGVLKNLMGKRFLVATKFSNSALLNRVVDEKLVNKLLPPLGSVGITAIYLAMEITKNSIFLTGLDFAYKLGKTHSRGTPYHLTSLINSTKTNPGDNFGQCLKRPLTRRVNKIGEVVESDNILYEYSLHAKELLEGLDNIYDLTTTGMDIGVTRVNNQEFLDIISRPYTTRDESSGNRLLLRSPMTKDEILKLEESIKVINSYLNKNESFNNVKNRLLKIEYFFDHYPEANPLSLLTEDNILRYYYTLTRYKRILTGK